MLGVRIHLQIPRYAVNKSHEMYIRADIKLKRVNGI